jgi:hypothetical protein
MADAKLERIDWAEDAIEAAGASINENESYSKDAKNDQDYDVTVSLSQSNLWKWNLIAMKESSSDGDVDSLNGSIDSSNDTDYESENSTDVQAPVKREDTQISSQASDRRARNTSTPPSSSPNPPKPKPAYAWHHEWFRSLGGWIGLALVSEYNLVPGPWGAHLLDLSLDVKRATPFISPMDLTHEDFIIKGTKMAEWRALRGLGIQVNVEALTTGECELLGLDQTMRWRCKPSPLRKSWTLIEVEESQDEESAEEKFYKKVAREVTSKEKASQDEVSQEEISQEEEVLIFAFEEAWF